MKTLVLGGVKSGKSRYAEQQVHRWTGRTGNSESSVIYLATAESRGDEFSQRIERHRAQRPAGWNTVEEPIDIAGVITRYADAGHCILVECLTLWMSNLMAMDETLLHREVERFFEAIENSSAEIILVSNETGLGIMPINEMARRFGDEIGVLHQRLADLCDRVILTVAGLSHELKNNTR